MKGELQKVVVVEGTEYTIQRFKGEQAFAIKYELGKVIVPFIKELQEAQNTTEEERPAKILGAVEHIFANTDYQTALRLLKTLVSQVYDSANRLVVPNDEFAQNTVAWYLLAWEVILFNYADVFSKLGFSTSLENLNRA